MRDSGDRFAFAVVGAVLGIVLAVVVAAVFGMFMTALKIIGWQPLVIVAGLLAFLGAVAGWSVGDV